MPGIITLFTAVAAERDKPSGDWDAVTLAVSLVTARCSGPPNEKIVVEVQKTRSDLIDALVSLCAVLLQTTLPDEGSPGACYTRSKPSLRNVG